MKLKVLEACVKHLSISFSAMQSEINNLTNQWILKSFITPCIECPWFFKKSFQFIQAINFFFFSMGGENLFKDAIEHTANLNMRMGIERKLRLPFLDSQTGVAQSHTSLWHPYRDRQPGLY